MKKEGKSGAAYGGTAQVGTGLPPETYPLTYSVVAGGDGEKAIIDLGDLRVPEALKDDIGERIRYGEKVLLRLDKLFFNVIFEPADDDIAREKWEGRKLHEDSRWWL